MTLKGYRLLQEGLGLLFGDVPAESWMGRVVVLLDPALISSLDVQHLRELK